MPLKQLQQTGEGEERVFRRTLDRDQCLQLVFIDSPHFSLIVKVDCQRKLIFQHYLEKEEALSTIPTRILPEVEYCFNVGIASLTVISLLL